MFMRLFNNRCRTDKGFTLVEIIVVLVILAILAAFTIPTMLGFVEDAKGKAYIAEAREVYVAAQATATEYIGTGKDLSVSANNPADAFNSYWVSDGNASTNPNKAASAQMKKYLGDDLKITKANYRGTYAPGESYWYVIMNTTDKAKVEEIYYVKNGYIVRFKETNATIEKLIEDGAKRPSVTWSPLP